MLSIVIPTRNEEKRLDILLAQIAKSNIDCEVIIADGSSDCTKQIARKYGCILTKGGTPSIARNNGATKAKYDLLFLDADVTLPSGFMKEFISKSVCYDITTCFVWPESKNILHKLYYFFKNYLNLLDPIPHCSGQCIYIKKEMFERIRGYDTELILGEEHDLVQRARKAKAKFKFFRELYVLNSPRRIIKEGFIKLAAKSLYSELYRRFKPIKKPIFRYDYDH